MRANQSADGQKQYRRLERSHLSTLYGSTYNVILWSFCELKRDLLYLLYISNALMS